MDCGKPLSKGDAVGEAAPPDGPFLVKSDWKKLAMISCEGPFCAVAAATGEGIVLDAAVDVGVVLPFVDVPLVDVILLSKLLSKPNS